MPGGVSYQLPSRQGPDTIGRNMNSKATRIGVPKVTRRDLGVAVASAAAVVAAGRAKPQVAPYVKKLVSGFRSGKKRTYTGPLDGFEGKVDGSAFNPTLTMCKLYESAPLRMTFNAKRSRKPNSGRNRSGPNWWS